MKRGKIPVVFSLATWTDENKAFDDWLANELLVKYEISEDIGRLWIERDHLIVLLDGFDEVEASVRNLCLDAIRKFRIDHGVTRMVICSRTQAFRVVARSINLGIPEAFVLLKPSDEDVDRFITVVERNGTNLTAVRRAMQHDDSLRRFFRSPLVLNVVARAYQDGNTANLVAPGTEEERLERMWHKYISAMFIQRPLKKPAAYGIEQAVYWIEWLAYAMTQLNAPYFRLDRLGEGWRSLTAGAQGAPDFETLTFRQRTRRVASAISRGLVINLPMMIFAFTGLCVYMLGAFSMLFGGPLSAGPLFGSAYLISGLNAFPFRTVIIGILAAMSGLSIVIAAGVGQGIFEGDIPAEEIHWSWARWRWRFPRSVGLGMVTAILGGLVAGFDIGFERGFIRGVAAGVLLTIIISTVNGFTIAPTSGMRLRTMSPKSRIRRSALGTLSMGVAGILVGGIAGTWAGGKTAGIPFGLGAAIGLGFGLAMRFGGYTLADYISVRQALLNEEVVPRRYAIFLDGMVERLILYQLGGAYSFVHRSLQEFLAQRYPKNDSELIAADKRESRRDRVSRMVRSGGLYCFDDEAHALIANAEHSARQRSHIYVETEHMLIALLEGFPDTFEVITGLSAYEAYSWIADEMAPPDQQLWGKLPFSRETQAVLHMANEECSKGGEITVVEILLGLIGESNGRAGKVLRAHGVNINMARSSRSRADDGDASTDNDDNA